MFSKFRSKLREPFGGKSSVEENNAEGENREDGATEAQDPFVTQITNLEGLVNKRTRDLQEAQEQLEQLSGTAQDSGEDGGEVKAEKLFTQPNQPKEELVVQPEEKTADVGKEPDSLLEEAGEKGEEEEQGSDEQEGKEQDDSMSNLFSQEEEEENPLESLLSSLPDITASELLAEAQELTEMMHVPQQN